MAAGIRRPGRHVVVAAQARNAAFPPAPCVGGRRLTRVSYMGATNGFRPALYFRPVVEIFRGTYSGQKPIRLVARNITATMPRIIAARPVIWPVK